MCTRAKERKHYTDEDIDDDEIEGKRSYSLEEKLQCGDYNGNFVIILKGHEFNLKYLQEHGLKTPIIFYDKTGLGMRVPSANFQVSDVKQCVGSRRTLDVMDVNTQRGLEMSMKEWVKYYETTVREKLLNVISLEFSHTRLENYVESPTVVRQVDWVDTVWPRYLKNCQTESTNIIEKMKYPKVQKYCLMSVAGCYTDFHIDFGGTSVWYHILHGKKVFWLIPPTEVNTEMYENWVLSGKQGDIFLADQVEKCQRIVLEDGYTFIIPSGWIHAVYTPKDSLVFGGNFLHSFNILEQLRVSEVEEKTHVPHKFRYPFYTEILWYVLDRYLSCMTGKTYLLRPETEKEEEFERADSPLGVLQDDSRPPSRDFEEKLSDNERTRGKLDDKDPKGAPPKLSKSITIELTRIDEKSAVRRSSSDEENLTPTKSQRSLRKSGTSAAALESLELRINDLKTRSRSPTSGDKSDPEEDISEKDVKVNNLPKDSISEVSKKYLTKYEFNGLKKLLDCLESLPPSKKCVPKDMMDPDAVLKEIKQMLIDHENDDPTLSITGEQVLYWPNTVKKLKPKIKVGFLTGAKLKSTNKNASSSIRRRRTRCKKCEPCTRQDCGECHYCKDMKKYGGPGRMKQSCISRQCMAPVLPLSAVCMICGKEDVDATEKPDDTISNLMECCICWEIIHPNCLKQKYDDLDNDGVINEDLPKSWECPKCCQGGKQGRPKLRVMKPKMKTTDNRHSSTSSEEHVEVKQEPVFEGKRVTAKEGSSVKEAGPLKMKKRLVQDEKPVKPVVQSDVRERRRRLGRPPAAALTPKTERKLRLKKRKLSNGSQSSDESLPSASVVTRSGRMVKRSCQMSQEVLELDLMLKRPKRERMVMGPEEEDRQNSLQLQSNHHAGARRGQDSRQLESIRGGRLLKKRGKDECGRPLSIQGRKGATDEQERLVVPRQQEELLCQSLPREITISLPLYVVRPAPIAPPPEFVELNSGGKHILNYKLWTQVFGYLDCTDLARCLSVCKTWNRWGINPCLWRKIDLHQTTIKKFHLIGIVQRQPKSLDISSAVISYKQLSWLVARLPQMKELKVINLSCATLSALCSSSCPLLQKLDISWSTGLDEEYFHNLVSPQNDRKPAVKDTSRMNKLKILSAAGTEITDEVLSLFPQHVPNIEKLDLSYCMLITDKAIAHLTSETFSRNNLKEINLTGCCQLTPECLQYLRECPNLMKVDFQSCEKITLTSLQKFVLSSIYKKFLLRNNKQILAYRDTSY